MAEITQKDYNENLELGLEEYKNSPNLLGLIKSITEQSNQVEEAIFEIRDEFWLNSRGYSRDVIVPSYVATFDGNGGFDLPAPVVFVDDVNTFDIELDLNLDDISNLSILTSNVSTTPLIVASDTSNNVRLINDTGSSTTWNINLQDQGRFTGNFVCNGLSTDNMDFFLNGTPLELRNTTTNYTFTTFGLHFSASYLNYQGKFYGLKITKDGVLVYDIVATKDGFMDKVTGAIIPVIGTGTTFEEYTPDEPVTAEEVSGGSAIGAQLDVIGAIFTTDRNSEDDETYRQRILKQAAVQYSGTPEDIIEAIKGLYGATNVEYDPGYPGTPGTFNILSDVDLTDEQINILAPAGINGFSGNNFNFNEDNAVLGTGENLTVA